MTDITELYGLVHDLDENAYHGHPALSSTQARLLLQPGGPALYRHAVDHTEPPKKAYDVGTAVHTKVLGVGSGVQTYPDDVLSKSGTTGTDAARAWAAEVRASGGVPLKREDYDAVEAMAKSLLAIPKARRVLELAPDREVSVFATDPDTGVECRARFDVFPDFGGMAPIAADVKTTAKGADPRAFGRAAAEHGYPVQEAHYLDVLLWATGESVPFVFLVVEKAPPYLAAVRELPPDMREAGAIYAAHARRIHADCTEASVWPGLDPDDITTASQDWYVRVARALEIP
jgi:hypothetical protein